MYSIYSLPGTIGIGRQGEYGITQGQYDETMAYV